MYFLPVFIERKWHKEMEKWNNDWTNELKIINYDCYERLAECRNNKKDLLIMANLVLKYNSNRGNRNCLDRIIEWVTDWNNQFELFDYLDDNYEKLLKRMEVTYGC